MASVAQHGDGVAQPEDLLHPVATRRRSVTPRCAAARCSRRVLRLVLRQAARRLVEDDHARAGADRGRDLHDLLLGHASARRPGARTSICASIAAEHRLARALHGVARRRTGRAAAGRPRQRFSATDRFSQNASSWWTMPTPAASASRGPANWTASPTSTISAVVRRRGCPPGSCPSVLLPAPFSPQSAWQEPGGTSKLTSSSARAPGKRFETCRSGRAGDRGVMPTFAATSRRYLSFRYASGTSVKPHCLELARPRPEVVLRDPHQSIGMISGTSFL